MTTRTRILSRAFGRLAMGDYEFDITADEKAAARLTLDGMMAEWEAQGLTLGFIPSEDEQNDAVDIGTPAWAEQALWSNLAVRMAADFGKQSGPALVKDARRGYDLVSAKTQVIPRQQNARSTLHGGGQRYYRRWSW